MESPTVFDKEPAAVAEVLHGMGGDFFKAGKSVAAVRQRSLRFMTKGRQMFVIASNVGRVAYDEVVAGICGDCLPP